MRYNGGLVLSRDQNVHFKGSSLYQRFGSRVRAFEEIENGSSVWYSMGAKMYWVCGGVSKVLCNMKVRTVNTDICTDK